MCKGFAWTKFSKIETALLSGCFYILCKYEFQPPRFKNGSNFFDDTSTSQEQWRRGSSVAFREPFEKLKKMLG